MLASALHFWAANQLLPTKRIARPFNNIATALFVLDLFLVMQAGQRHYRTTHLLALFGYGMGLTISAQYK